MHILIERCPALRPRPSYEVRYAQILLPVSCSPSKRIVSLDVLRGIAIAGMVLVHVAKASYGSGAAFHRWEAGFDFFITGKFYTIFALLFGIGFGLELSRSGGSTAAWFLRRLVGLTVIMAALKFIFGSSLLYYVIWGAPLVLLYRLSSGWLVAVAVALLYLQASIAGAPELPHTLVVAFLTWADPGIRGPFVLAMFIAGFLAVRHGLVTEPATRRSSLIGVAIAGITLTVAGIRTEGLGLTYAAAAMLLVTNGPRALAVIGRASLSNYALHLLFMHAAFRPWGLGLSLDWRWILPVSAITFSAMIALSALWLRTYEQGPLEWLWRWMTRLRQPLPSVAASARQADVPPVI